MTRGVVFVCNVVMREDIVRYNKDVTVKMVKVLIAAVARLTAKPMVAAKLANEVLKAPSVEVVAQQIHQLQWPGDFRRKTY